MRNHSPAERSVDRRKWRVYRRLVVALLPCSSAVFTMRCVFALLPVFICAVTGCSQPAGQAQTPSPIVRPRVAVEVALVETGQVVPQVTLVGAVIAARHSVLGSAVDGRVTAVNVDIGDPVGFIQHEGRQVGQPIAQLLTETISIEIAAAQADLELRGHELAELEAGTRVEELAQAAAAWESAKAGDKYAEEHFKRIEGLYSQARTVSQEEFDEARTSALAARQSRLSAKAAFDLAVAGPRSEQKDQARARLAAQRAAVERLRDLKTKYTIRAPFEGYVVAKHTEVGAWLSRGDPVAEVVELNPIDIELQVPESLVSELHLGDQVPLVVDALKAGADTMVGRVDRIVPSADLRARTFPVRVRLENPKNADGYLLKAGMLARASVPGRPTAGLLVPHVALVADKNIVMAVAAGRDGPVAREVAVQLGKKRGSLVEVRGSLNAGDRVITSGLDRVRNGQPLEIAEPASSLQ